MSHLGQSTNPNPSLAGAFPLSPAADKLPPELYSAMCQQRTHAVQQRMCLQLTSSVFRVNSVLGLNQCDWLLVVSAEVGGSVTTVPPCSSEALMKFPMGEALAMYYPSRPKASGPHELTPRW